jgi:hypothetical protein
MLLIVRYAFILSLPKDSVHGSVMLSGKYSGQGRHNFFKTPCGSLTIRLYTILYIPACHAGEQMIDRRQLYG